MVWQGLFASFGRKYLSVKFVTKMPKFLPTFRVCLKISWKPGSLAPGEYPTLGGGNAARFLRDNGIEYQCVFHGYLQTASLFEDILQHLGLLVRHNSKSEQPLKRPKIGAKSEQYQSFPPKRLDFIPKICFYPQKFLISYGSCPCLSCFIDIFFYILLTFPD